MYTMILRTHTILMTAAILALSAGLGCDAEAPVDETGEVAFRPGGDGGWNLNTSVFNDLDVPAVMLAGTVADSELYVLTGAELDGGVTLDNVAVEEGELVGFVGKNRFSGDDLDGAQLQFNSQTNGAMTLYFEHLVDGNGAAFYVIEGEGEDEPRTKLCAPDDGKYGAYLLGDVSADANGDVGENPGMMYMACTSGAVGKAREWGYDPEDIGLSAFEMIIRAIRADYCGDGQSHTSTGSPISIWDAFGVSQPSMDFSLLEGNWSEDGLVCRGDGQRTSTTHPSCFYTVPECSENGENPLIRTFVKAIK